MVPGAFFADICRVTHPGFESDEFENHFHSEDSSEDHIKNVHYIVKERRLTIVLQIRDDKGCKREINITELILVR